jgi:hypothetical protein
MKSITLKSVSLAIMLLTICALSGFSQNAQPPAKTTKSKTLSKGAAGAKMTPQTPAPAPPGRMSSVTVLRLKPDMVNQWIEFQKNEVIPALKKAGVKERSVFSTAAFGEAFEYVVITPVQNLSQYDEAPPLRRSLGDEGYRAYQEKQRRMIIGSHTFYERDRMDLSHLGNMTEMPALAVVATFTVIPGRTQDFENLIKSDVLPACKKANATGYFVSQTILGGDISQYTTVTVYKTFAEIGAGSPLLKGMGEAGYERFLRKTYGIVQRAERAVYRYNPELSFGG